MKALADTNLGEVMYARKSVRHFDPTRKIPTEQLQEVLAAAQTAPSAWNLQHWKFLIIESSEGKDRLLSIAWGQKQVQDCSTVVIVLGDKEAYKNGEKIFRKQVDHGYMPEELMTNYLRILPDIYGNHHFAEKDAIRNASLAAMQIMLAAKMAGIDSCPMIGFKADELREELNIPHRYIPVMMIALGYGMKSAHATIRLPLEEVVIHESF